MHFCTSPEETFFVSFKFWENLHFVPKQNWQNWTQILDFHQKKATPTAGLPRVGSLGFSDNYLNDALPPPAYNFDENSQTSMSFGGLRFRLTQKTGSASGSADNEVEVPAERKKIYWDIWGKPQRTAIVNMTPLRFDFHFTCNWSIFPHQALRPTNRIGLW